MIAERIAICAAILLLTIVAPYWSVFLLVVASPWSQFASDVIGWDPRVIWSLLLALRAGVLPRNTRTQSVPRAAIWGTLGFVLVSYLRLKAGSADVSPDEVRSAEITLLYFVAGMSAGYAILKLTDTRRHMLQILFAAASSLAFASGFGLFQAVLNGTAGARIAGTTGNPNSSAAHLAIAATVLLLCWRIKLPGTWLYSISFFAGVAACILTFSRMGTIGCIIGVVLTLYLTNTRKALNWKLVAASVIVLTIVVGLTRSYLASVRNTLPYSDNSHDSEMAMASQEAEDLTRLEAVQFAFQKFIEQPVLGVGFGTIADRNYAANGIYLTTHDTYAQVLAGTGLVGAAFMLTVIVSVFRSIPSVTRRYIFPICAELAFCSFFIDFMQLIEVLIALAILIAMVRHLGQQANYTATPTVPTTGKSMEDLSIQKVGGS